MKVISNAEFGGERPLFESHDLRLENVIIRAGESAIKECSNIEAVDCRFEGNYPFWHVHGFVIDRCFFDVGGRSALWYSDHLKMTNTRIDAPKMFREMHDIEIENVEINDADEVFWRCRNLNIKNLKLHGGTYPFMFSSNIRIDGLESDSKYVFQYVKDVEIHNAKITTKDAFWEVENVTIYDSELNGEYLGWHSHNLRLVNCHITGEQPLCYAHDLVLENCTFGPDCDRAFEYSSVQATIKGAIGGVIGATILGAVYGALVSSKMAGVIDNSSVAFAVASLAGALLSILGDLAASAIKRNYNVKDYGTLIPGHGGIMDRFDSAIFTAPVVYWSIEVINKVFGG